jgi:hypothetical protein
MFMKGGFKPFAEYFVQYLRVRGDMIKCRRNEPFAATRQWQFGRGGMGQTINFCLAWDKERLNSSFILT